MKIRGIPEEIKGLQYAKALIEKGILPEAFVKWKIEDVIDPQYRHLIRKGGIQPDWIVSEVHYQDIAKDGSVVPQSLQLSYETRDIIYKQLETLYEIKRISVTNRYPLFPNLYLKEGTKKGKRKDAEEISTGNTQKKPRKKQSVWYTVATLKKHLAGPVPFIQWEKRTALDDFMSAVKRLTEDDPKGLNCFAHSLIEGIFHELRVLESQQALRPQERADVFFVAHPLPWEHEGFRLFPILNNRNCGPHYDTAYLSVKEQNSYFIEKIIVLSRQMAERLRDLGEENGLPLSSLTHILSAMIGSPCESMEISDHIPAAKRDAVLIDIGKKINDLLMEAFIVFMMIGFSEWLEIRTFIERGSTLQEIKVFLAERTCCPEMEKRLSIISSQNAIDDYMAENYIIFNYIEVARQLYMHAPIDKAVQKWGNFYKLEVEASEQSNLLSNNMKGKDNIINDPDPGEEW